MKKKFEFKILVSLILFMGTPVFAAGNVLFIGDAQSATTFGDTLQKGLEKIVSGSVRLISVVEAQPVTFITGDTTYSGTIDRKSGRAPVTCRSFAHLKRVVSDCAFRDADFRERIKLKNLVASEKPDVVLIELGDGIASYKEYYNIRYAAELIGGPQDKVQKKIAERTQSINKHVVDQVQTLKKELSRLNIEKCIWILPMWTDKQPALPPDPMTAEGPASFLKLNRRRDEVSEIIKANIQDRCDVIDSSKDLGMEKKDFITINSILGGPKSGVRWAEHLLKVLETKLPSSVLKTP